MFRRARRLLPRTGIGDQFWMARKELRHPFEACDSPNRFEQAEQEQCFTPRQKECRDHVTGPMGTEVNSRITDRQCDEPVKPSATSVKQRAKNSNYAVGGYVSRGKRWSRPVAIGRIGKPNSRLLKQSQECRTGPLQLYHSHIFYVFGAMAIDRRF